MLAFGVITRKKNSITPLGIALLVLFAAGCFFIYWRATHSSGHLGTLERIRAGGVVRIGYANEAPYGYLDPASGEITGEAPEIARVILERLGAENIEPVVTEFGSLIPGLQARRFDLIAAGMYVTPERAQEINFSNPTYAIGEAFLVAKGNPQDLHSYEDVVANPNVRLGVMGGSVEVGYAESVGVPSDQLVIFRNYPIAISGLTSGQVDAVAATMLTANDLLGKSGDAEIELARPFSDPVIDGNSIKGYGAFGFRQEDVEFLEAFNAELKDFIGSPEHLELVEPFGFSGDTLPGDVTTEELTDGS